MPKLDGQDLAHIATTLENTLAKEVILNVTPLKQDEIETSLLVP